MKTLAIQCETALPIREISALTVRVAPSGDVELLAVGDEDFAVITAELEDDGAPSRTWRHDLWLPLVGSGIDLRSGSGFEGIGSDGDGSVFVLQEEKARLLVFSPDLSQLLQVLELVVPETTPYGAAWHADENRRREGLLVLDRGHMLVAKQKAPVYLIEFGPADDDAIGVGPDTVLADGAAWQRPEEGRLVALAAWELEDKSAKQLPSVNDIAIGRDSSVFLLSAEARVIARLEDRLVPGERAARATGAWKIDNAIPGGKKARPEGLAIVAGNTPLVGVDSKVAGHNVVVLDPPRS
jgi:hypothetical protein